MPDFTSALYLGMRHPRTELPDWQSLSTGKPAFLETTTRWDQLSNRLAQLQHVDTGLFFSSTLQAFWDLFGYLAQQNIQVFYDIHLYPVGKAGVERAKANRISVSSFRHQDPFHLHRHLRHQLRMGCQPVVVTDGWCPLCGRPAPIREYLRLLKPLRGLLVIDDTQGLGVLGRRPGRSFPLGHGGGGLLPFLGIQHSDAVILVGSLAKAFGVPTAFLSGTRRWIQAFQSASEVRQTCSPPSTVDQLAVENALRLNRAHGTALRQQLTSIILDFRHIFHKYGLKLEGGVFPVQTRWSSNPDITGELFRQFKHAGIACVPIVDHCSDKTGLSFLISVANRKKDLQQLESVIQSQSSFLLKTLPNDYSKSGLSCRRIDLRLARGIPGITRQGQ